MNSFYIGMDVGGTNVRIGVLEENLKSIKLKKFKFKRYGNVITEINENIYKIISTIIKEQSKKKKILKGIGVSLAAIFDRSSGKVLTWPNNRVWDGFPLKDYLVEKFNVYVILEDDSNSASLGEFLIRPKFKNLIYITISTGVSCGIILNNKIFIGDNGWAGEIGHVKYENNETKCNCGNKGCLQSLVSGDSILKKFNGLKNKNTNFLYSISNLEIVSDLAKGGDKEAIEVFVDAGKHIGKIIYNMVMLLNITSIIVGGGVTKSGDIFLDSIRNEVKSKLGVLNREVIIEQSQLQDKNGLLGIISLISKVSNKNGLSFDLINVFKRMSFDNDE